MNKSFLSLVVMTLVFCFFVSVGYSLPKGTIFVTTALYNGNLGGLSGADAKCQAEAQTKGFSGTWIALLSTTTTYMKDRIPDTVYKNILNQIIANSKTDLFDGIINNSIYPIYPADDSWTYTLTWTGSDNLQHGLVYNAYVGSDSAKHNTCLDWTCSNQSTGVPIDTACFSTAGYSYLYVGVHDASGTWLAAYERGCNSNFSLYCVLLGDTSDPYVITTTTTTAPTSTTTSTTTITNATTTTTTMITNTSATTFPPSNQTTTTTATTTTTIISNQTTGSATYITPTVTSTSVIIPTCRAQGGSICNINATCTEKWLAAKDTDRCCSGVCAPFNISIIEETIKGFNETRQLTPQASAISTSISSLELAKDNITNQENINNVNQAETQILDVTTSVASFENDTNTRGPFYSIRWLFGFVADQEKKDSDLLINKSAELLNISNTLKSVANTLSDTATKNIILAEADKLKTQADQLSQQAIQKRENAQGLISWINKLFGIS